MTQVVFHSRYNIVIIPPLSETRSSVGEKYKSVVAVKKIFAKRVSTNLFQTKSEIVSSCPPPQSSHLPSDISEIIVFPQLPHLHIPLYSTTLMSSEVSQTLAHPPLPPLRIHPTSKCCCQQKKSLVYYQQEESMVFNKKQDTIYPPSITPETCAVSKMIVLPPFPPLHLPYSPLP